MDPLTNAARFFAFTYYLNGDKKTRRTPNEAGKYARGNWEQFLPYVQKARYLTSPDRVKNRSASAAVLES